MESNPITKKSRKFLDKKDFDTANEGRYYLLPFRFHRLTDTKEVIVNETGDYLVVPTGTAELVYKNQLTPDQLGQDLYTDLVSNFFISEHPVPALLDVIATRYRTKKSFLDHFTALHIFVISLRCEHTCIYCQVSRVTADKDSFDMSITHINEGIKIMMQSPNPHVTMEFQGGEALLAFERIVYAVKTAKLEAVKANKKISFVICTNLSLINEDILTFCKEHHILISTSLDGPAFIHNKNRHKPRSDSHQLTIDGIQKCREQLGEDNVSALVTTASFSLDYPHDIVEEYVNQGFHNIFLRPISPYGFATKNSSKNKYDTEKFLTFYKIALDKIIEYNLKGYYLREDYAGILLKKMLTPFPVGYVDLQSPAGLINSVIVFNYDGHIYASDEARMLAEMNDFTFQLGKLGVTSYNDIFYGGKSVEIAPALCNESLPGCSDCAFQQYCGADPVFNHTVQGNIFGHRPTSPFCQKNMAIIEHLLLLMDSDKSIAKIFRTWIS